MSNGSGESGNAALVQARCDHALRVGLTSARETDDEVWVPTTTEELVRPPHVSLRAQLTLALRSYRGGIRSPRRRLRLDRGPGMAILDRGRDQMASFRLSIYASARYAIGDFRRVHAKRGYDELRHSDEKPGQPIIEAPTQSSERGDALRAMLAPLSARDRLIVTECEIVHAE